MSTDIIGIEFMDFHSKVIRKSQSIIENEVYAPIIEIMPNSIYKDRDYDGECMFSFEFIEDIVNLRRIAGMNIYSGRE